MMVRPQSTRRAYRFAVAVQLQSGLATLCGGEVLVAGSAAISFGVSCTVTQHAVQQEDIQKAHCRGVGADGLEWIEIHRSQLRRIRRHARGGAMLATARPTESPASGGWSRKTHFQFAAVVVASWLYSPPGFHDADGFITLDRAVSMRPATMRRNSPDCCSSRRAMTGHHFDSRGGPS